MKKAIERLSIAQMTSNESGKTSASGTMGVIICLIGALCFALGCVGVMWFSAGSEIITQSIVVIGMGAALLGYRKSKTTSPEETHKIDVTPDQVGTTNLITTENTGCSCDCKCEKCMSLNQPLNS
jgi:hypothetical protein